MTVPKSTLKKKIPLMVNEPLRKSLETSTKATLEKIRSIQRLAKENLNIDLGDTDKAISFIGKSTYQWQAESMDLQNELLFIKFEREVSKMMTDHPSIIQTKALDMFCDPRDREGAKEAIQLAITINKDLEGKSSGIELDHFVLNGEFVYNSKLDTRLKEVYTVFCKNNKQKDLKDLAEKLREIVDHSRKIGLISNTYLGILVSDIIDIDSGEIKYNHIARK